MERKVNLDSVLDVFHRLGIEVRHEHIGGGGGLCRFRDRRVLFVDLDADMPTRLDRCIQALEAIGNLEAVYLPPKVREALKQRGGRSEPPGT